MTVFGEKYSVQRNGEMIGQISRPLPNGIGQRLDDAIRSMIQESKWTNEVLCQAPDSSAYSRLQGGSACALLVIKNNYYIFDPHSRDTNNKVVESGASILLHFTAIRQLCTHIQELGSSLNCNYYEIITISVNSLLFERYVTDQKRRQEEKNETKVNHETSTSKLTKREREALKHEQNHLRMVKKHQELTYSNKEKTKSAESK